MKFTGHPEPIYHVKYAESDDGISWRRTGLVCIDYDAATQAIGRPWVVRPSDRYGMWFSYRGLVDYRTDPRTSYRVGYAESLDGLHWERKPDPAGLERSADGWDSMMVAYTNILRVSGSVLCFYNGNGFGQSGLRLRGRRTAERPGHEEVQLHEPVITWRRHAAAGPGSVAGRRSKCTCRSPRRRRSSISFAA